MLARCKFVAGRIEESRELQKQPDGSWKQTGPVREEIIEMHTQYDENDPEDTKFSSATPWGHIKFGLSNPALLGKFKQGKTYYLDLTEVEES